MYDPASSTILLKDSLESITSTAYPFSSRIKQIEKQFEFEKTLKVSRHAGVKIRSLVSVFEGRPKSFFGEVILSIGLLLGEVVGTLSLLIGMIFEIGLSGTVIFLTEVAVDIGLSFTGTTVGVGATLVKVALEVVSFLIEGFVFRAGFSYGFLIEPVIIPLS